MSKAEAPTLATVKPPGNPKISDHFISEKKLEALPVRRQPPELAKALADLQTGSIEERKARLRAKTVADMVYVRGGAFMRGDFARLMGVPGVTRMTYNEDDKVLKEITLSDFWIGKYKVTYAEFDVFTDATARARTGTEYDAKYRHLAIPAHAHWQNAREYCLWLGQLTGLPMDLPTEAQWEYAARSRGQFFAIPTNDGTIEYGTNVPYGAEEEMLSPVGSMDRYPISLFPPNPLGLYDMSGDGAEWVKDWYAEDAYAKAGTNDPQGPATGTHKVTRSWWSNDLKIGVAVWRRKEEPMPVEKDEDTGKLVPSPSAYAPAMRCAVNSPR
ncbi:formylglycine-generating enzyme family protein [Aquabacterium sp.]|uniref:formylglycine-generating enzyme family protein n=1 Tax=Aquabacterium sp. TaxID=1872578 RepID=UPI003D6D0B65